ncbi:Rieske 2Fe-2S domain-containing protein [Streptomyces sp. AD55]|uniref:Rieske 2Fe-2S domain-containing protein n=1 Tax=Streptomyces sp. AD55 TaxID=3242895 RepID=UPI0035276718
MSTTTYDPETLREAYRHVWFVVARSEDIGTPQPAQLLDQPLVVFRAEDGTPHVLDRRCVHRGGDLSMGKVIGSSVQCPYHGWRFDGASGGCSHIPSLAGEGRIPPKAAVRSYPAVERFGHVWTCLGDPVFDLPHPPEIADLTLEWRAARPIPAKCGFMAATENFRDMAHFPFVHEESMGEVNPVVPDLTVEREGREVRASYHYPRVPGADFSSAGDSWMHYHSYAPGIATILYDFGPEIGKRYLMDFPSPVSYDECVIYWAVATDEDFTGGSVDEILALETVVFNEDTPILEGLRPREVPLADQALEVSCPADIYTLNYRRATKFAVDTILKSRRPGP